MLNLFGIKRRYAEPAGATRARLYSTEELKSLWESLGGNSMTDDGITEEAIHLVLNERGEGKYCAV